MDEGGVDAAVIHPPGWDPDSTEMAFKAVRDYPGRFAILGAFPLNQPDKRALVETWRSQPGMLGLRYGFLAEPMRTWLADGTLDWLWAAAERAGVPIAMLATDSLPHIGRIAERHPGLRLTIDHLGGRGGHHQQTSAKAPGEQVERSGVGVSGRVGGRRLQERRSAIHGLGRAREVGEDLTDFPEILNGGERGQACPPPCRGSSLR